VLVGDHVEGEVGDRLNAGFVISTDDLHERGANRRWNNNGWTVTSARALACRRDNVVTETTTI
jgi:hypothetical protein